MRFRSKARKLDIFGERWRWERLGLYNSERARGIVHTEVWQSLMAVEQAAFDKKMAEAMKRET